MLNDIKAIEAQEQISCVLWTILIIIYFARLTNLNHCDLNHCLNHGLNEMIFFSKKSIEFNQYFFMQQC